jgi:hypothetical protein
LLRSPEGQLALSTSRGLLVHELIPNPSYQTPALNFRSHLLTGEDSSDANPWISK